MSETELSGASLFQMKDPTPRDPPPPPLIPAIAFPDSFKTGFSFPASPQKRFVNCSPRALPARPPCPSRIRARPSRLEKFFSTPSRLHRARKPRPCPHRSSLPFERHLLTTWPCDPSSHVDAAMPLPRFPPPFVTHLLIFFCT